MALTGMDGLACSGQGLIWAGEPWSGAVGVVDTVWAIGHTTQVTEVGWRLRSLGRGAVVALTICPRRMLAYRRHRRTVRRPGLRMRVVYSVGGFEPCHQALARPLSARKPVAMTHIAASGSGQRRVRALRAPAAGLGVSRSAKSNATRTLRGWMAAAHHRSHCRLRCTATSQVNSQAT